MINTTKLIQTVQNYRELCKTTHKRPTYYGISHALGVSPQTVSNVVHGTFNGGHEYSCNPAPTRCIDNADFEILTGLFECENTNL